MRSAGLIEAIGISDALLLLGSAFVAGALNAVAGGGSFLTLPALMATGVPSAVANATGTLALLSGYLSGAWAMRSDIAAPPGLSTRLVLGLSVLGGATGAFLLLWTPDAVFRQVIPWLLLFATCLFVVGPRAALRQGKSSPSTGVAVCGVLGVTVYGGYFNGGLGILLLALFGALGQAKLLAANGLKNVVSALLTLIAVVVYVSGELIAWREAALMSVGALAGGYIGGRGVRRLPMRWVRGAIVAIGLSMSIVFFFR